jgi:ribonuclease P protein component
MTPSLRRLRKRSEFLRVARAGRRWATPGLILQARRRQTEGRRRGAADDEPAAIGVGFTASRKVGKAVERNRARRRLRALAGEVLPQAGAPGHDYVLIARAGTLGRPYMELSKDLKSALARVSAEPRTPGARRKEKTRRA